MARSYANIFTAIWEDDDFTALSSDAQRVYFMLVTQPDITACGSLALTLRRWASLVRETDRARLEPALAELDSAGFVRVDEDTEELLVRTFVKHDGGHKHGTRLKAVLSYAQALRSKRLRTALAVEFHKLGVDTTSLVGPEWHSTGTQEAPDSYRSVVVTEVEVASTTHTPETALLVPAATATPRKRGTRIPDDWMPDDDLRLWTLERLTQRQAGLELEKFRNYWSAKTGKDATKLDWPATWRNWVINAQQRAPAQQQHTDDLFDRAAQRMGVTP